MHMERVRNLTKEFQVGAEAELSIENRAGSVTVRGDETEQVRVEVTARLWAEADDDADEQAALIEDGIRHQGRSVTIQAPPLERSGFFGLLTRGPRIDYQVTVPRATRVTIRSRSGRIEVERVRGPLHIEVRSGRVAASDIAGDVELISRTGAVQVESIGGSLTVESRTGSVRASRCEGDVTVRSRTGFIQIEEAGRGVKIEARSGAVRYEGEVRGAFDIDVSTGSIRLALDPNSVFFLDAQTTTGAVRSDLPLRRDRPASSPSSTQGHTVRVRARTGSIHILPR